MQNYSDAVEKHVFDHCNVSPRPHGGGGGGGDGQTWYQREGERLENWHGQNFKGDRKLFTYHAAVQWYEFHCVNTPFFKTCVNSVSKAAERDECKLAVNRLLTLLET
jgi:hypothetical protein